MMLTTRDIQELINVDRSTIYRMAESGRIPAVKVGRQWRFPAERIEHWLAAQRVAAPGAEPPAPAPGTEIGGAAVQAVVDLAADLFGVMAVVTDMDGVPATAVANPCGLYSAIAEEPGGAEACMKGWRSFDDNDLQPKYLPSPVGFLCARAFIRVGTELAGMLILGGIASDEWPPAPDRLAAAAEQLGVPAAALDDRVDEVHRLGAADRTRLLDGLPGLARIIARIAAERGGYAERLDQIAALADSSSHSNNQRSHT